MTPQATRVVSANPLGTGLSRFVIAQAASGGDSMRARLLAESWKSSPEVVATLAAWHEKAAIPAGSTTDASWASPLAPYGISHEAITIMRGRSILGALEPKMTRVPLHVKLALETGAGITGGWVAAGQSVAVQKTDFATSVEAHFKFGVIVALSKELLRFSDPAAEATIRNAVLGGLSAAIDNQLLLPTVTAVSGLNPASLTNGSTEVITTGTTSAQISADLSAMLAAISTPGAGLAWVMRPKTMAKIALTLGSQAAGLPHVLFGVPVIASISSPAQIALIDAAAVLYSDSGQFDLDISEQALIQQDSAPEPPVGVPVMTSLFQSNTFAVKALRWLAWLRPTATSASFMTVAY